MSIENAILDMSNKRCPFGVSETCITRKCAAWEEIGDTYKEGFYEYDITESKPGLFSDWEVYEIENHGGYYRTVTREVSEWDAIERCEEWVKKSKTYKIRKWIPKKLISEGTGYCKRF